MKIGILTQPLHTNYGGLLQCWALQRVLREMGHEAWVVQRQTDWHSFLWWADNAAKNVVRLLFGRPVMRVPRRKEENQIRQHTRRFVEGQIVPRTSPIYSTRGLRADYARQHYDAYVVGSDQVWRPIYSPCQPDFFLGFLPGEARVRRVAYAASFGTDKWEFSPKLAARCRALAGKFDAVSVRESGGVGLCRAHLGVAAEHVLDPTLLHGREVYERLVGEAGEPRSAGDFFCYVLDRSAGMEALKRSVAESLGVMAFEVMPRVPGAAPAGTPMADRVFPPVTAWLRAFMDAEYVLTDSFHGSVFSIIFHRPFVALGNAGRGQARFHSLLGLFGLEDRLVTTGRAEDVTARLREPIDWARVDRIKREWQAKSTEFLRKALNEDGK